MASNSRFTDNGDGTITDGKTGLLWAKEDSWQTEQKWVTWDEAFEYAQNLSNLKFAGFNDWRLPRRQEALSLLKETPENQDKYGNPIQLDPVFPEGALPTIWIYEDMTGNDGYILDLKTGEVRMLYKSKSGRMAARPVRGKTSYSETE